MAKFRIKTRWWEVLAGILVVVTIFGVVMGIASISKKDKTQSITSSSFVIGGLNDKGQFVETDRTLVSDFFACQGLRIEPGAYATGTYRIFYYSEDKIFLGATESFSSVDGVYNSAPFTLGVYARIVLTPDPPANEDAEDEGEFRIRFWEISKYVRDFDITVYEKQDYRYLKKYNVFDKSLIEVNKMYGSSGNVFSPSSNADSNVSKPILIPDGTTAVSILWKDPGKASISCIAYLADAEGNILENYNTDLGTRPVIEVDYRGVSMRFASPISSEESLIRYIAFEFSEYSEILVFFSDDPADLKK